MSDLSGGPARIGRVASRYAKKDSLGLNIHCWRWYGIYMSTITEIERAIERLPAPQIDELAHWLEGHRARRASALPVDTWLDRARGAARPDVTTADVMSLTRGDE